MIPFLLTAIGGYLIGNSISKEFADGGQISSKLKEFYSVAKKSDSVINLQIIDENEFKFILKSEDTNRVHIEYNPESDTIVFLQYDLYSNELIEDDDISLEGFKKFLN